MLAALGIHDVMRHHRLQVRYSAAAYPRPVVLKLTAQHKMQEMILAEKIKRGILVFSVAPSDLCHAEVAAVLMYYIRENMTEKLKQHRIPPYNDIIPHQA